MIITADHGNCDTMWDKNHIPVTSHTLEKVPLIITKEGLNLKEGKLADIAPTLISLMGLDVPNDMSGEILYK